MKGLWGWYFTLDLRRRGRLLLSLSIVLGCLAAWAVHTRLREMERQLGVRVEVIVASADIPANAEIQAEMLTWREVPLRYVLAGMVPATDQVDLVGGRAAVPIGQGQPVTRTLVVHPVSDLSLRSYTLTGSATVILGALEAGDRVDILAVYRAETGERSEIVMRDIQVVEVQADGKPAATLAVTQAQAEQLAWLENFGKQLRLLRRSQAGMGE